MVAAADDVLAAAGAVEHVDRLGDRLAREHNTRHNQILNRSGSAKDRSITATDVHSDGRPLELPRDPHGAFLVRDARCSSGRVIVQSRRRGSHQPGLEPPVHGNIQEEGLPPEFKDPQGGNETSFSFSVSPSPLLRHARRTNAGALAAPVLAFFIININYSFFRVLTTSTWLYARTRTCACAHAQPSATLFTARLYGCMRANCKLHKLSLAWLSRVRVRVYSDSKQGHGASPK
eukprot:scaffold28406_cov112-Isochrysis_galbana.AAC.2